MNVIDDQSKSSALWNIFLVIASTEPGAFARVASAFVGGTTLAGVWGKLMFTAADTKDEASALYPIDK